MTVQEGVGMSALIMTIISAVVGFLIRLSVRGSDHERRINELERANGELSRDLKDVKHLVSNTRETVISQYGEMRTLNAELKAMISTRFAIVDDRESHK